VWVWVCVCFSDSGFGGMQGSCKGGGDGRGWWWWPVVVVVGWGALALYIGTTSAFRRRDLRRWLFVGAAHISLTEALFKVPQLQFSFFMRTSEIAASVSSFLGD
jgi:hypothetical protein